MRVRDFILASSSFFFFFEVIEINYFEGLYREIKPIIHTEFLKEVKFLNYDEE